MHKELTWNKLREINVAAGGGDAGRSAIAKYAYDLGVSDAALTQQRKLTNYEKEYLERCVSVHDHFDVPMDPTSEDGITTIASMHYYEATGDIVRFSIVK